jgi:hypothetical protein
VAELHRRGNCQPDTREKIRDESAHGP